MVFDNFTFPGLKIEMLSLFTHEVIYRQNKTATKFQNPNQKSVFLFIRLGIEESVRRINHKKINFIENKMKTGQKKIKIEIN